ncbi:MAG TPA: hypothetical protein VK674_03165 [Candidatus Limnocylindria bacterium]|nr:hypothetical protein [Candidatus Limnocylindria bacterium]
MKTPRKPMTYETPLDSEILKAYMHKNSSSRVEVRRIKRALRKLAYNS